MSTGASQPPRARAPLRAGSLVPPPAPRLRRARRFHPPFLPARLVLTYTSLTFTARGWSAIRKPTSPLTPVASPVILRQLSTAKSRSSLHLPPTPLLICFAQPDLCLAAQIQPWPLSRPILILLRHHPSKNKPHLCYPPRPIWCPSGTTQKQTSRQKRQETDRGGPEVHPGTVKAPLSTSETDKNEHKGTDLPHFDHLGTDGVTTVGTLH